MPRAPQASLKKKRSTTLQNLFGRKKKGDLQTIIVLLDDQPVGEVQFDENQPLKALRAKLVSSKLPLPKNFGFLNGATLVKPPAAEDATKACDVLAALDDKIIIQTVTIEKYEAAAAAGGGGGGGGGAAAAAAGGASESGMSPRAASPAGRPQLKRTKPKGGATLDGITGVSLSESEALAIDAAHAALGGIDAIAPAALPQIHKLVKALLADKADAFKDNEELEPDADDEARAAAAAIGQLYSAPLIVDAVKAAVTGAKASLPTGASVNATKYHAVAHADQGSRGYMEDKHVVAPHLGAMFGVAESTPTYFYGV